MEEAQLPPSSGEQETLDEVQEQLSAKSADVDVDRGRAACTPRWARTACAKCTVGKALLCAAIVVVWLMMAVPTVMFYVPQV